MPRQRKTQSGEPALAVGGVAGVRYGEGQDLQQLQRTTPIPNARAATPSAAAPVPAPAAADPTAGAVQGPTAMPQPGLLLAPTTRPNEPITAGLTVGPGPGPEVLGVNPVESPTGRFMRELARVTGRERFAELARRSGL